MTNKFLSTFDNSLGHQTKCDIQSVRTRFRICVLKHVSATFVFNIKACTQQVPPGSKQKLLGEDGSKNVSSFKYVLGYRSQGILSGLTWNKSNMFFHTHPSLRTYDANVLLRRMFNVVNHQFMLSITTSQTVVNWSCVECAVKYAYMLSSLFLNSVACPGYSERTQSEPLSYGACCIFGPNTTKETKGHKVIKLKPNLAQPKWKWV